MEILKVEMFVEDKDSSPWVEDITRNFNNGSFEGEEFKTPLECAKIIVTFYNKTRNKHEEKRTLCKVRITKEAIEEIQV